MNIGSKFAQSGFLFNHDESKLKLITPEHYGFVNDYFIPYGASFVFERSGLFAEICFCAGWRSFIAEIQ